MESVQMVPVEGTLMLKSGSIWAQRS